MMGIKKDLVGLSVGCMCVGGGVRWWCWRESVASDGGNLPNFEF